MLWLEKFAAGRETYFLASTWSASNKTNRLIEADGTWLGRGRADLGLRGMPVSAETLASLFGGRDPATNEVLNVFQHRVSIAGFELVFAAPKSVSVLFALGSDDVTSCVAQAHERSIEAVFGYLERNACHVRRRPDSVAVTVPAEGFTAACFLHRTSRSLDPHLHSHVLIANLAATKDGRWSALDARALFGAATHAQFLYTAHLRHELHQHGLSWKTSAGGFGDVVGIPKAVLREFSRRRQEIDADFAASGRTDNGALRLAAIRTRPKKENDLSFEELRASWTERALRSGMSMSRLNALTRIEPCRLYGGAAVDAQRTSQALSLLDGPFTKNALVSTLSKASPEGAPVESIEHLADTLLDSSVHTVVVARRTTRTRRGSLMPAQSLERRFSTVLSVDRAARLRTRIAGARPVTAIGLPRARNDVNPHGPELFVASEPGAGVLHQLAEVGLIVALIRAEHRQVIAFGPDSRRAAQFEAVTAVPTLTASAISGMSPRSLVVVDDPGRFSDRELEGVLDRAEMLCCPTLLVLHESDQSRIHVGLAASLQDEVGCVQNRFVVDGTTVLFCRDLGSLIKTAAQTQREDPNFVMVASDPVMASLLGISAVSIMQAEGRLEADPATHIGVLGGTRVLGELAVRLSCAQRTHLLIRPPFFEDLFARALEIVEPAELCRVLGRPPDDLTGRRTWRLDALHYDRRAQLGQHLSLFSDPFIAAGLDQTAARRLIPSSEERTLGAVS